MPPRYACTFVRIQVMKLECDRHVCEAHSPQFPTGLPNACDYLSSRLVLPGNTGGRVRDVLVTTSPYSAPNIHIRARLCPRHQREAAVATQVSVSHTQAEFYVLLRRNIAPARQRKLARCRSIDARRDRSFRQQDLQVQDTRDTQTF